MKIRSSINPQDQAPTAPLKKSIHPVFKIKPKSPRRSVHQLFIPRSSPDGPLDQQLIHKPTPYEDRIRGSNYKEIVTPKIIKHKKYILYTVSLFLVSGIFRVYKLGTPGGISLPLISILKSLKNANGIKKGSSCSCNQSKEQEHHRRKW